MKAFIAALATMVFIGFIGIGLSLWPAQMILLFAFLFIWAMWQIRFTP